jgi:capsular polysaccharide biosynthesis protein
VEFREYWDVIRKRGWIILLVAIVAAAAALGLSTVLPKVYKASIQLSVNPARADWGLSQAARDLLRNYVLNITSHRMTQKAIDQAQLDMSTYDFLADLDVSADSSNMSITIQAESGSPEEARQMAQTLADIFVAERDQWNSEQDKRDRIEVTKVDDIRDVPLASPNKKFNALAGAVFGAIIGVVIVFVLEWLQSDVIRSAADVEKMTGLGVLAAIPSSGKNRAAGTERRAGSTWLNSSVVLIFLIGLVIGASLGALMMALL